MWFIVVMGIFGGTPAGAIVAIPAEILKPENRGPGLGLFITWFYGAMPVLLPIAGWCQYLSGNAAALRLSGHADESALLLSSSRSAETLVLKKIRSIQDAGCYRDGP